MTRRSELILQRVRGALNSPMSVRRILIRVRAPSVVRLNMTALKVLLSERNERGIYITVNQPDKHLRTILEKQNVVPESEVSSISEPRQKKVIIAGAMFSPARFAEEIFIRLADPAKGPPLREQLDAMGFVMLDDLSALGSYNSPRGISAFLEGISALLNSFPALRFIAVAARDSLDGLGPDARKFFNLEVDIPDEWLVD